MSIKKLKIAGYLVAGLGMIISSLDGIIKDKQLEKVIDERIEEKLKDNNTEGTE